MADISKITLPSGSTYNIKDAEARTEITELRETVAGIMEFKVSWAQANWASTSAPSTATLAQVPSGVTVYYNSGASTATGTLAPTADLKGKFYLVYSNTQTGADVFDEYVVGNTGTESDPVYVWEKIGDTQIDLSDVVTGVTLNKSTDTVIGSNSTFTITQPTITMALADASATGKVGVITRVSASTTNVKATASGANTAWNSKDAKTAVTGVSATKKKLTTTTITGVSGSTTPSVVQGRTSQTTATGGGTASTTNTDWLKSVSVSNETLTIGAAKLNTQTTYSANAPGTITVPTAASSATTVATGALSETSATTNVGATIATDAAASATASVIGASSTFTITQPTIALATGATAGTGVISVATGASGTTKYIGGTASGANTAWNNKDTVTVLTNGTTITVTKG